MVVVNKFLVVVVGKWKTWKTIPTSAFPRFFDGKRMWMDVDKWGKQKRKDAFIPSVRLSLRISHFSEEPELVILSHIFTKKSSAGYLELLRPAYFSSFFGFSTLSTHRPVPARWKRPARAHQECMRKRKKLCRDYPRFCAGYQHGKLSQKNGSSRKVRDRDGEKPNKSEEEMIVSIPISKSFGDFNLVVKALKLSG